MNDPAVSHLISTSFVPIAHELQSVSNAKDEGGDFYRSVYKQAPQYQGLWLISPDGHVLATAGRGSAVTASWPSTVLADLKSGMKKFGAISPRRVTATNPLPYRGIGVRPDGGVTLAISDRRLLVDDLSKLKPGSRVDRLWHGSVELSSAEWLALAPTDTRQGSQWAIPETVGRRFWPLLTAFDRSFGRPQDVTEVALTGRVESVRGGIASLVYAGRISGTYDSTRNAGGGRVISSDLTMLGGLGAYDIEAREMLSLTWVWYGFTAGSHARPRAGKGDPFGTVLEWRREAANPAADFAAGARGPETRIEVADSTPEEALKTFLLALAAHDEATLRTVTLPHDDFDLLLKGPSTPPDQLVLLKARLDEKPPKRLKAGDPVKMPDGVSLVIKPVDVREGRVVLWPAGAPLPSRLENVRGHWKVFATPFIAARKSAEAGSAEVQEESLRHSHSPAR